MQQRGVPLELTNCAKVPRVTYGAFSLPVLKRHVRFQSRSSQRYRFGLDIPVVPFSQRDLVERRPASGPIRIGDGHKKAGVLLPERRLKASFPQKDRYKFFPVYPYP